MTHKMTFYLLALMLLLASPVEAMMQAALQGYAAMKNPGSKGAHQAQFLSGRGHKAHLRYQSSGLVNGPSYTVEHGITS